MKLVLKKEHTGLGNYISVTCPIAMALRDAGFLFVGVGARLWSGYKDGKKYADIEIPEEVNDLAMRVWSVKRQAEDITFDLPLE